jgi:hypothetical protein
MLIGLHGKARSGKDTIFEFIKEDYEGDDLRVIRDAFADRLKLSAARALGFKYESPTDCLYYMNALKEGGTVVATIPHGDDVKVAEITGREYLQLYGTEAHRDVFGHDFWVQAVLPDWDDETYGRKDILPRDILVVTDVRFPNEAEQILNCGGSVWHIVRDSVDTGDAHASEVPLPREFVTRTITNNHTLQGLQSKVHIAVWEELRAASLRA